MSLNSKDGKWAYIKIPGFSIQLYRHHSNNGLRETIRTMKSWCQLTETKHWEWNEFVFTMNDEKQATA